MKKRPSFRYLQKSAFTVRHVPPPPEKMHALNASVGLAQARPN